MGRRKRAGFGDVLISRAAFERAEGRCPSCHRPIGPRDEPNFVTALAGATPRLATMRCGKCSAELTVRFEDDESPQPA